MKPSLPLLVLLSLLATLTSAQAEEEIPASSGDASSLADDVISHGSILPKTTPLARATVMVLSLFQKNGEQMVGKCTGTVIGKTLVLTAAHCLSEEGRVVSKVGIVTAGGTVIKARSFRSHEGFVGNVQSTGFLGLGGKQLVVRNDIALLRLEKAVDASALVASLPTRAIQEGETLSLNPVGYGKEDGSSFASYGVLRIGRTTGTFVSAYHGGVEHIRMENGSMTCKGDSGGPIFLANARTPTVVGVTSHGDTSCEQHSVATSVSAHLDWIRATAAQLR